MKEYEVGYGKPPVEHQIKKGFTKNYAGRPRRSAASDNDAASAMEESSDPFIREAARKIAVREGDAVREIRVVDAFARTLSSRSLKGDIAASRLFMRMLEKSQATQSKQSEAAFAKAVEDKTAALVTLMLSEIDGLPTDNMPLHPDQIVLRADGKVEVLPTLAAVEDRRRHIARRDELEKRATRLQGLVNEKRRKRDVDILKSTLAELRRLKKLRIVDDKPGIEDAIRRQAEQRVAAIRGALHSVAELTQEELIERLKAKGLPIFNIDE